MNAAPPHEAMHRYLKDKSTDVTDSTVSNYQATLTTFCDWLCDEGGIETLDTLTSDEIQQFKEASGAGEDHHPQDGHDLHQGFRPLL